MSKETRKAYKDVLDNDNDFDGMYIIYLLEKKLKRMEEYFRTKGHTVSSEQDALDMQKTIKKIDMFCSRQRSDDIFDYAQSHKEGTAEEKRMFLQYYEQEYIEKEELVNNICEDLKKIIFMWD